MANKPEHQTIKVWVSTLRNLRQIYALTGEQMVKILDRVVKQELERVKQEQEKKDEESKPMVTRRQRRLDNELPACVLEAA